MGRKKYTTEKIRKLRRERKKKVPAKGTLPTSHFQYSLGDLKGAGHLRINGNILNLNIEERKDLEKAPVLTYRTFKLEFETYSEYGEVPLFKGYLQSGSDRDKEYRVKGWLNPDGTVRLEVVQ